MWQPVTHLSETFPSSLARPFLLGLPLWIHGNQITVGCEELAGHFKSRHTFTQTVVFMCSVGEPLGEGSFWLLGKKKHNLFLIFGCQSHHTCGLWMTLTCRVDGRRTKAGWTLRGALPRSYHKACAIGLLLACVSQKHPLQWYLSSLLCRFT